MLHLLIFSIQYFLDLIYEIMTVKSHYVLNLLHQVYHVCKRQPLTIDYFLGLLGSNVLQILKRLTIWLLKFEINLFLFVFIRAGYNIWKLILKRFQTYVSSFLLLWQNHDHYFLYLQFRCFVSWNCFYVEVLHVKIINMSFWVVNKELFFFKQTKSQSFKALVELFHIFMALIIVFWSCVPVKHISSIRYLFFLHTFVITPDSGFYKMNLQLLLLLKLDRKPHVSSVIELVNELKKWSILQQIVTKFVLYTCQHLKELRVIDLGVS